MSVRQNMSRCMLLGVLAVCVCSSSAYFTAVSQIKECINDGTGKLQSKPGEACKKMMIVAMTVEGNEGKSQQLEANIQRAYDGTTNKNVQLKTPIRIRITKSPVLINYRLYQVGYVNHNPYEIMMNQKGSWCRDDWFARDDELPCGFQYDHKKHKIFDSQGFCCNCDKGDHKFDRGESSGCLGHGRTQIAHCLRFDHLYDYVFGLYPAELHFNIIIKIEKVTYTRKNGQNIYELLDTLTISPTRRIRSSKGMNIRAEYIADFHANEYMPVLSHKYLLVPNLKLINSAPWSWKNKAKKSGMLDSIQRPSEWLLVGKEQFALSGLHCNRIGVSYSAFRNQGADQCRNVKGSCLQGQPQKLWESDMAKKRANRKGQYMLYNFGKVHEFKKKSNTDYQINFITDKVRRSLITIRLEADSLKMVVNKSPARIVEAFIDSFESLSANGELNVILQNTGSLTATYKVYVAHCSAGVDFVKAKSITLDPAVETNLTFIVHSFHSVGKENHCEVELYDQTGDKLDNMTVNFETTDTCFCYGYCGCSCGNNVTDCPPPPERHDEEEFNMAAADSLKWLLDASKWVKGNLLGLLFGYSFFWIIAALIGLGIFKVALSIYNGDANCDFCLKTLKYMWLGCKCCCGNSYRLFIYVLSKLCRCFFKTGVNMVWGAAVIATGRNETKYIGRETEVKKNTRRPMNCDGMCRGARQARRMYRKKLRVLKRRGAKTAKMLAWWEKGYTCTCVVSDTKSILEIFKGMFFFLYCPLLPLWWLVEFFFQSIKRKRRRSKRMAEFKKKKALQREKDANTYLMLDKYTRGTKEKKVVDFNAEKNKSKKGKKSKKTEDDQINAMEEGTLIESEDELNLNDSETTDTDAAGDMDELLNPGYPVFFNYAGATPTSTPKSLVNAGTEFSIRGRLIEETVSGKSVISFDLYNYTLQNIQQIKKKVSPLAVPIELNPNDFKMSLQPELVQRLVTFTPLFPCLNGDPNKATSTVVSTRTGTNKASKKNSKGNKPAKKLNVKKKSTNKKQKKK